MPVGERTVQVRDGVARIKVKLPDTLTVFKLRAKAISGPDRFGFATGEMMVRQEIVAQPALPRFVRPGDRFDAGLIGRVVEGLDPKALRPEIDTLKKQLGSGIAALIAVNDGRASVAAGVTDDLTGQISAVDLVKAAVAALGGQGGGGRPDMAQGGGPEGDKAAEALTAIKNQLASVSA